MEREKECSWPKLLIQFYLPASILFDAEAVTFDISHKDAALLFCALAKQSKLSSDQILSGSCSNPHSLHFT